jgi:hypothetical protein
MTFISNLQHECNMCHNKHHIFYIVMVETIKLTSHMGHEPWPNDVKNPHSIVMTSNEQ